MELQHVGQESGRIRQYNGKSRTGCVTCRKRRVKCDETKPQCGKCQAAGRRCEYLTWNKDSAWVSWTPGTHVADTRSEMHAVARSVPSRVLWNMTSTESNCVGYFLGTLWPGNRMQFDKPFWLGEMSYASFNFPEIRQLVIALTIMQRNFQRSDDAEDQAEQDKQAMASSMSAYRKALAQLRVSITTRQMGEVRRIIIACGAFTTSLEKWYGDDYASRVHVDGSIRSSGMLDPGYRATLEPRIIRPYARQDLEMSTYFRDRPPLIYPAPPTGKLQLDTDTARSELDNLGLRLFTFVRTIADVIRHGAMPVIDEEIDKARLRAGELQTEMRAWYEIFGGLLREPSKSAQRILICIYHHFQIVLGNCLDQDETRYDHYGDSFRAIVAHAGQLWVEGRFLYLDAATVLPVYLTALKCRVLPDVRQHALGLLQKHDLQEGLWRCRLLRHLARRAVEVEHELTIEMAGERYKTVPSSAMIHDVLFEKRTIGRETTVNVKFRYRPQDQLGDWVEIRENLTVIDL